MKGSQVHVRLQPKRQHVSLGINTLFFENYVHTIQDDPLSYYSAVGSLPVFRYVRSVLDNCFVPEEKHIRYAIT